MNDMHRILRRFLPVLYIRNWYTGQFEFSTQRAGIAFVVCVALVVAILIIWWLGKPILYTQSQ